MDDDSIPISALQHFLYCPRQCALIHVERQWSENRFTAEGRILHKRTDQLGEESRPGIRIVRALPLTSSRLGLRGMADVVEFHEVSNGTSPFPIEYKRGRPKPHRADEVQICAQALCLEEMFDASVPAGALYYGRTNRRLYLDFDQELRALTLETVSRVRFLLDSGHTPPAEYEARKCGSCSLLQLCMPKRMNGRTSARAWITRALVD